MFAADGKALVSAGDDSVRLWDTLGPIERSQAALVQTAQLVSQQPSDSDAWLSFARIHLRRQQWAEAISDTNHVLALRPDDRRAVAIRSQVATKLRAWLQYAEVDAGTLNKVAWQLVGKAQDRRSAELALPLIEKAVAQASGNQTVLHTLGVTYYRLGRYDDAIAAIERGAQQPGRPLRAYELYLLAMCHYQRKDAAGARRDFDAAVRWQEQAKLTPEQLDELQALRVEAEALLQGKAP